MMRSSFFQPKSEVKNQYTHYRTQIQSHLEALHVRPNAIKKILNCIDSLPGDQIQVIGAGALAFLTELTDKHSQCEQHYHFSSNIAEFFCTMTNIGFFAVACYHQDWVAMLVCTFSALSHAIPLKRLNDLDKIAAIGAALKILYNYDMFIDHPNVLLAGFATMAIGSVDLAVRYEKLKSLEKYRAFIHSAWHLSAAFTLHQVNQTNTLRNTIQNTFLQSNSKSFNINALTSHLQTYLKPFSESVVNVSNNILPTKS